MFRARRRRKNSVRDIVPEIEVASKGWVPGCRTQAWRAIGRVECSRSDPLDVGAVRAVAVEAVEAVEAVALDYKMNPGWPNAPSLHSTVSLVFAICRPTKKTADRSCSPLPRGSRPARSRGIALRRKTVRHSNHGLPG